ncbi:MAG: NrsF family protein [Hyphomicrobium sp.]|jgi:hypothetical protein
MRTNELIAALAADCPPSRTSPDRSIAIALAIGSLAAALAFVIFLGPRPDFAAALATWRFDVKFVVTGILASAAIWSLFRLSRPVVAPSSVAKSLLLAPLVLLSCVAVELVEFPSQQWSARLIGQNSLVCLTVVPLLALAPLASLLLALRTGAPASPTSTGAIAGLAAGAIAAFLYAALCTNDSPLFVTTWYTIAILAVAFFGALVGRRMLRW